MKIQEYVDKIIIKYKSGITSGQLYLEYLKILFETYTADISIAEGLAESTCGTPDYVITKGNIPVGYILTFDIDKPLDSQENKKEFALYKKNLANHILTNYREFHLYRDETFVSSVSIVEFHDGKIVSKPENHQAVQTLIREFLSYERVVISSASYLSILLARKAQILACLLENAIIQDEKKSKNQNYKPPKSTLKEQLTDIDIVLNNGISAKDLADIYAQTISFGMFAARLYRPPALEAFSRQNAYELIPLSYAFLRKLFEYIAGKDLDDRLIWIIDEFVDVFRTTDIAALMENFRTFTQQKNPVIHFYKNFLDEYNPRILKERGEILVTEPIVRFMIQAVNDCRSSIQFGSTDHKI